ncbi:hypothetical protein CE155_00870 [Bifidobacterium breve]|nr:hypothetical protein CE155_00870 [Bifidobacterium breve]
MSRVRIPAGAQFGRLRSIIGRGLFVFRLNSADEILILAIVGIVGQIANGYAEFFSGEIHLLQSNF